MQNGARSAREVGFKAGYGAAMESAVDYWTAKALLDWQVEMGADEAISDAPIDRYGLQDKPSCRDTGH